MNETTVKCQACGWSGITAHACAGCGGQDWEPAQEPAPKSDPPAPTEPVSPSRKPRR